MYKKAFSKHAKIETAKRYGRSVSVKYTDGWRAVIGVSKYLVESKYGRLRRGYRVFRKDRTAPVELENLYVAKQKELKEVTCKYCKKIFERSINQIRASKKAGMTNIYCSRSCAAKDKSARTKVEKCACLNCGKEFERSSSYMYWHKKNKNSVKTFCSKKCYNKWRKERSVVELVCDNCKKKFKRARPQAEQAKRHFCSRNCAHTFRAEQAMTTLTCSWCEKEFQRPTSRVPKKQKRFFCGRPCLARYMVAKRDKKKQKVAV